MKTIKWLWNNLELTVMTISLAVMAIVMMFQVIMRYFFASPMPWPEELSRYLLVTSCFFGSGFVLTNGFLIRMDVVINMLPKVIGRTIDGIGRAATILFFGFFFIVSISMVQDCYNNGLRAASLPMPYWILYAIMSLGLFLSTVRAITSFAKWLTAIKNGEEDNKFKMPEEAQVGGDSV